MSKIGYTLAVILGFIIPGMMFIFVWNRQLFLEMDIFKLMIIAFGIPFIICIPNAIICMNMIKIKEMISKNQEEKDVYEEYGLVYFLSSIIIITVIELIFGMVGKIFNEECTIKLFIMYLGSIIGVFIIVTNVVEKCVRKFINRKKKSK